MTPHKKEAFSYRGTYGLITRVANSKTEPPRNVWWAAPGDTEIMFSLRADGLWRAFPGPADGPHLEETRIVAPVKQSVVVS